eukprot:TRINITY_DN6306_c0_g1_i1.p1 TRINITY_DN6306_c0_g1~~TRINITY_DN6306_c0_g1_i1.p1  ORF type:complete len:158 (+),score=8.96 TRINITY_DN6306_c0_g1_i1:113-586(+)
MHDFDGQLCETTVGLMPQDLLHRIFSSAGLTLPRPERPHGKLDRLILSMRRSSARRASDVNLQALLADQSQMLEKRFAESLSTQSLRSLVSGRHADVRQLVSRRSIMAALLIRRSAVGLHARVEMLGVYLNRDWSKAGRRDYSGRSVTRGRVVSCTV